MTDWTKEQKNVFENLGKGNLLVSASAGSGKTTVMVKCISDLLNENIDIENVLVMSFTIASAADMRAKIIDNLFELAKIGVDEKGNKIDVSKIQQQIDNISFAEISTIDSFCSQLIRENFEYLGIEPSFKQMENDEIDYIKWKLVKDIMREQNESNNAQYLKLAGRLNAINDDDTIISLILRLYNNIYINPYPEKYIEKILKSVELDKTDYEKIIIDYYKDITINLKVSLENVLIGIDLEKNKKYKFLVVTMLSYFDELVKMQYLDDLVKFAGNCSFPDLKGSNFKDDIDKNSKTLIRKIRDFFKKKILDDISNNIIIPNGDFDFTEAKEIVKKLLSLVEEFKNRYNEYKLKFNVLDFMDLERLAIKLLSNRQKAKEISEKYDYIFVDEYQDINPLQEFILQKISNGDNMFMVGDSKQSIYAFRDADPLIFLNKIKIYNEDKNSGLNCKLTQNFRSRYKILDFVDRLFSIVMTDYSCGLDYKTDSKFINRLTLDRITDNDKKLGEVGIKLFTTEKAKDDSKADYVYSVKDHVETMDYENSDAYYEGLGIAKKIREIVSRKQFNYSDIALLFGKRKSAKYILQALRDENIPYLSESFEGEEGNEIKSILINLIRVIDNELIDIAYTGYLLSYFCNFDENELIKIRRTYKADTMYQTIVLAAADDFPLSKKCKIALDQIKEWRHMSAFMSVGELLNEIITATGFDAYVLSTPKGKANYVNMVNFIENLNENAQKSPHSFLEFYDNAKSIEENCLLEFGNAVKIMTIHGSKGLEFPIVFVCQVNEQFNNSFKKNDIILDRDIGVGTKIYNTKNRSKCNSYSFSAIKIMESRRMTAEKIRLFYVALTRAKEKLFISGTASENSINDNLVFPKPLLLADSNLDILFYAATFDMDIRLMLKSFEVCDMQSRSIEKTTPIVFSKADEIYKTEISRILNFKYPYADSTNLSPKYSVTELNEMNKDENYYIPSLMKHGDGRLRGIAYHSIMENIDFSLSTLYDVEKAISEMVKKGIITAEQKELIDSQEILDCINTDIIKHAVNENCIREKSFMLNLPASDVMDTEVNDNVLIQGTIDLLILGNENIIVDFKSSVNTNENLLNTYKEQLKLYVMAAEKALDIKIDKKYLYSFKARKFIELQ